MSTKIEITEREAREALGKNLEIFAKRDGLSVRQHATKAGIKRKHLICIQRGISGQKRWRIVHSIKTLNLSKQEKGELFYLLQLFCRKPKRFHSRSVPQRYSQVYQYRY